MANEKDYTIEFLNYDNIATVEDANAIVTTYVNESRIELLGKSIEIDPEGRVGYIRVTETLRPVEGLEVGDHAAYIIMSSGFEFMMADIGITIEIDPLLPVISWLNLYNTYNQRRQLIWGSALAAFETYDFDDYDTQVAFILAIQNWCEGIQYSAGNAEYLTTTSSAVIEGQSYADTIYDWEDNLQDAAGLTLGWRKGDGYGNIADGDDIRIELFEDIDSVMSLLNAVQQPISLATKNNGTALLVSTAASGIMSTSGFTSAHPYVGWSLFGTSNTAYIQADYSLAFFGAAASGASGAGTVKAVMGGVLAPTSIDLYIWFSASSLPAMLLADSSYSFSGTAITGSIGFKIIQAGLTEDEEVAMTTSLLDFLPNVVAHHAGFTYPRAVAQFTDEELYQVL